MRSSPSVTHLGLARRAGSRPKRNSSAHATAPAIYQQASQFRRSPRRARWIDSRFMSADDGQLVVDKAGVYTMEPAPIPTISIRRASLTCLIDKSSSMASVDASRARLFFLWINRQKYDKVAALLHSTDLYHSEISAGESLCR